MKTSIVFCLSAFLFVTTSARAEDHREKETVIFLDGLRRPEAPEVGIDQSFRSLLMLFLSYSPGSGSQDAILDFEAFKKVVPQTCYEAEFGNGQRPFQLHIRRAVEAREEAISANKQKLALKKTVLQSMQNHLASIERFLQKSRCQVPAKLSSDLASIQNTLAGQLEEGEREKGKSLAKILAPKASVIDTRTLFDGVTAISLYAQACEREPKTEYQGIDPNNPPEVVEALQKKQFNESFTLEMLRKCVTKTDFGLSQNTRRQRELEQAIESYQERLSTQDINGKAFNETIEKLEKLDVELRESRREEMELKALQRYLEIKVISHTPPMA